MLTFVSFIGISQTPQLSWQFANVEVINAGTQLQFDVEVKASEAGSFHRDLQIYFDYNTVGFGSDIVASGAISYTPLALMNTHYSVVNMADNTTSKFAIITEADNEMGAVGSASDFNEVTMTYQGLLRFTIDIDDNTALAGIAFDEALMNGGQYYQSTSVIEPVKYVDPCLYTNDLSTLKLSVFYGQITYLNAANTPLTSCTVELNDGAPVGYANTDINGNYAFAGYADGSYTLYTTSTNVWGGVTVFDALYIEAAASGYDMAAFLGWVNLNYLAADVDGNASVDVFDVLYAKALAAEYAGLEVFEIYKFEDQSIDIISGLGNQDYKGICNGDVDESYTPPAK